MKCKFAILIPLVLLLFVNGLAWAEENATVSLEEVLVTATRMATPARKVASSVTVIDEQQIEHSQARTVSEVLRSVPALDVVRLGGPGAQTSVFIRGAKSEHTLVLLNGVEMNDPSLMGRSFDFAHLSTENIKRIEVLRGPQSTLYGSDAIGGVINIITKKGQGKPSGYISAEAGSFETFRERAGLNSATELFNYSLGISRLDTDGISSADEDAGNHEEDGYENTSFSARLGITPTKKLKLSTMFRYSDDESDLDDAGGVGGDDPNHIQKTEQMYLKTKAEFSLYDDLWKQELSFSLTDHDREINDDPDISHPNEFMRSSYEGKMSKFSWQHNLFIHETNTLTLGLETEEEEIDSNYYSKSNGLKTSIEDESARTNSAYIQDQISLWNSWFTTLGMRVDDHEEFGTETTYRITSSYIIQQTGTKIKGTYGTGFKAPSLFQLYSPQYGNEELDPEKSIGWDVGLEQKLLEDKLSIGVTYFNNDFEDLIEYNYVSSTYTNVGEAETEGVELFSYVRPMKDLTVRASYTYTDTENEATGEKLMRRPELKAEFDVNYSFLDRGNVNVGLDYIGTRDDTYFDPNTYETSRVELDEYYLARLAASYKVLKHVEIFGRIENLLDEDYQEVKGYGTPGISAYGGIKLSL